jgi:sugar phosphate isomerase/epimerase
MARTIVHKGSKRPLCAGAQCASAGELIEIAPQLAAAGYDGVELHPHHLAAAGDRVFRRRLRDALADAGLVVAAVFGGVPSDPPSVAMTKARAEMAADFGAEVVFVVPPSRRGGGLEQTAACVREVCVAAGQLGLDVAVHNHAGTAMTTVAQVRTLLELVDRPEAGLCLDVAHLALFEDELPSAITALSPLVCYIHFKDLEAWARVALGELEGDTLEEVAKLTPAYTDVGAGSLDLQATAGALPTSAQLWTAIEMETLRAPTVAEQCAANAHAYRALLKRSVAGARRP